jgi:high-affinity Fe2+/Pb2+ permease
LPQSPGVILFAGFAFYRDYTALEVNGIMGVGIIILSLFFMIRLRTNSSFAISMMTLWEIALFTPQEESFSPVC